MGAWEWARGKWKEGDGGGLDQVGVEVKGVAMHWRECVSGCGRGGSGRRVVEGGGPHVALVRAVHLVVQPFAGSARFQGRKTRKVQCLKAAGVAGMLLLTHQA